MALAIAGLACDGATTVRDTEWIGRRFGLPRAQEYCPLI
jgi:hypothetical protein